MTDTEKLLELAGPSIVKLSNDVLVLLDKTAKIIYVNDRVETWIGYKKEELIGKNMAFSGLMTPTSTRKALANLFLRFLGKEIPPYTVDFITKDGRIINSTIKGQIIKDKDGKVACDLVVIIDIFEKKKYEDALTLEKEKSDKYIDIVGNIIVIIDREEKITLLNKKGCEMLKTTKEEAIGKNWFESYVPEVDRAKTRQEFKKIISGQIESLEDFENSIMTTGGEIKIVLWNNTYLKDINGNIYATLSSGSDITKRKEEEQEFIKKSLDLKSINELMVGRELKMVELKKEIEELKKVR